VDNRGFTLLELVVVIGLLGLMLVVTVPRFRQTLTTNELKASARKIIGLVREVRDRAIRDHKDYRLHIDIGANRFWVVADGATVEDTTLAKENGLGLPAGVRVLDVWLQSRGKQTAGEVVIRFSRKGYIEQSIFHLGADDGDRISLLLTPFLGEIKIYDGYHEVAKPG
jgi:prepilin-type N-terminal cleavage/methylation domain-containing protein